MQQAITWTNYEWIVWLYGVTKPQCVNNSLAWVGTGKEHKSSIETKPLKPDGNKQTPIIKIDWKQMALKTWSESFIVQLVTKTRSPRNW